MSSGCSRRRCEPQAVKYIGKDGRPALVRPIRETDETALIEAFDGLSAETVYRRFHSPIRHLSRAQARRLVSVDQDRSVVLVAEEEVSGKSAIIAVARYEPTETEGLAEAALVVGDGWQNNGLGRFLLRSLMRVGTARRVSRFRAEVLWDNRQMLHLLAKETEILERRVEANVVRLLFRGKLPPETGQRRRAGGDEEAATPLANAL